MSSKKKGGGERPVSLHPLPFKEAVKALLETKPAKGKPEPPRGRQKPPGGGKDRRRK